MKSEEAAQLIARAVAAFERMTEAFERLAESMGAAARSVPPIVPASEPDRKARKAGELMGLEERFVQAWNEFAAEVNLPILQVMTSRDRSNFAARLKDLRRRKGIDGDEAALSRMLEIMRTIREQSFALGSGGRWKIDAHDFLTASKFGKVEAKKYGDEKRNGVESDGSVRDDSLFDGDANLF